MKHIIVAFMLAPILSLAQQPISLPKDNGKTTSFCETMDMGSEAKEIYDTTCTRMQKYAIIRQVIIARNEATAFMSFSEMQQGVYGKVTIVRRGKYISYCVQDFMVNNIPLDEWLNTSHPIMAEQVKGRIFSSTVLLIASIKNNAVLLTQK